MSKPKPPQPPNPITTASAQTAQNVGTAIAQQQLNNIGQVTPEGSLSYEQTGTYRMEDPNSPGKFFDIPQFTATQTLSESQQRIKDQQDAASLNLARIGNEQSARIGGILGQPVNINNEAAESRLMELGRSRLDPLLDRRRESTEARLSAQGIRRGSEAYDRGMEAVTQGENDAYNQLLLSGRGQAVQEALAERNQPINEITALMSGGQVSQPNFVNTNPAQLANTDIAGLIQSDFANRMGIYNQRSAQRDRTLGGLFSLASSGIRAAPGFF